MTELGLAQLKDFPQYYKDAIERAIGNWSLDVPEDQEWPDYFRGEVVATERESEFIDESDFDPDEYDTQCVWFQAGWKSKVSHGGI